MFLDFDGTLVDLAASPDAIRVPPGLPALLRALDGCFEGALAVLTGRALGDLDRHLPAPRLAAAGQHGAERRLRPDREALVVKAPALPLARGKIADFKAAHPALFVEDKGASVALHYRSAPALQRPIESLAARLVTESDHALEAITGKFIVELRPVGSNKGAALAAFLRDEPFAGRRPLMLGDDVTDEAAFAAALDANGSAIKVGAGESRARWHLADPQAVRSWLAHIPGSSEAN